MVKNLTGGNKMKGQARKNSTSSRQVSKLRVVEEEGEVYAQVSAMLGNGMCHVESEDYKLLCIIRGKFRGRGKRDNILKKGTWVLIGLREWDSAPAAAGGGGGGGITAAKMQKCDLLEVYTDHDKERLKGTSGPWKKFIANDLMFQDIKEEVFDFTDDKTEEYKKIMSEEFAGPSREIVQIKEDDEIIDFDDI